MIKVQSEQHEWARKEALGEYEYKRTLIREQTEQQIELAKTLQRHNKITLEEYNLMIADLKKVQERSIVEIDKTEKEANAKKVADARKAAKDRISAAAEAQKKRAEEYEKEFQAAQDALANIMKDGLDKQQKMENLAYERSMKALSDKMAKYKSMSEYDIKMRAEIQTQIEALTFAHERRMSEFEWSEHERRIKVREEILQSELAVIKKGTEEEMQLRLEQLSIQTQLSKDSLKKRIQEGEISEKEGKTILLNIEKDYQMKVSSLSEEYEALDTARRKAYLQNQIDSLQLTEDEKVLRQVHGYQMSEEEYAKWRSENLAEMDEHQRRILLLQEQTAQEELNALVQRGRLSTQTVEEYEAEVIAAKKKSADAQSATNAAIVKNEQVKATAMKTVTSSLTSLLDTLGESNEEFAKMSKIITLAQIAIDTGKALSAGIASASSMPFPSNIAAIATTVATILANITTAISTVKSAKFAKGGKVVGPGTETSDSIPAMLSNGEFVMTAKATRIFEPLLRIMNKIGASESTVTSRSLQDMTKVYENTRNSESSKIMRDTSENDSIINTLSSKAVVEAYEALNHNLSSIRLGIETNDSMTKILSNGSMVMTSDATRIFEPMLRVMNKIGSSDGDSLQTMVSNGDLSVSSDSVVIVEPLVQIMDKIGAGFANGGKVIGSGTSTSDSIPAMLSNGEFVMTAKATRIYEPLLHVMNKIGTGVPMQVTNSYRTFESNEALAQSFETAAKEIKPVVSVVEITDAQERVEMIESLDTY